MPRMMTAGRRKRQRAAGGGDCDPRQQDGEMAEAIPEHATDR